MKRYFIADEYFGSRVYDSKNKAEEYYDIKETVETKRKLLEYIGYFV